MGKIPKTLKHGMGATMTLEPEYVLVSVRPTPRLEAIAPALSRHGLIVQGELAGRNPRKTPEERINNTPTKVWARVSRTAVLDALDADPGSFAREIGEDIEYVAPVYRIGNASGPGGLVSPLPNVLLIRRDERRKNVTSARLAGFGLREIPEKSKNLTRYRYFVVDDPNQRNAYEIREQLQREGLATDVRLETMPMVVPITFNPNDPLYTSQWNMVKIGAGGPGTTGWNIQDGTSTVTIAILDQGVDLAHDDIVFAGPGINLGTMSGNGGPTGNHGTPCAGIAAATINNTKGIAGLAGDCRILSGALQNWTDVEVANGLHWAADQGADVISMSFGQYAAGEGLFPIGWDFSIIDPEIDYAFAKDVVLCAATGNEDVSVVNRYPARHPKVMACGASNEEDVRKSKTSNDGGNPEPWWGSNYGPGISVVAPGVHIPATDREGSPGYGSGDYILGFNGTSSATPHVAGLAALLRSAYPALTNVQVRNIIERTAAKAGTIPYATDPAFPNGTRNAEMGYGRINVLAALDYADLMIRDWSGDDGTEPSAAPGGNFWSYSDMVVRPQDDNVFDPGTWANASHVERGQTNYVYVRVRNNGPAAARNVTVNCRITPYVGTQFVYPNDWTQTDATHVAPAPMLNTFANIPAGSEVIAKFSISAAQVDQAFNWTTSGWHPCMVASVTADNDHAFDIADFSGSPVSVRRNNLAQRNLTVVDVLAGATVSFPFLAGNLNNFESKMQLVVTRGTLPPSSRVVVELDQPARAFPQATQLFRSRLLELDEDAAALRFLDAGRVEANFMGEQSIVSLAPGSVFAPAPRPDIRQAVVTGGDLLLRGDKREVLLRNDVATIVVNRRPGAVHPVTIRTEIPATAKKGEQFLITVAQKNAAGTLVGGASVVYRVK